MYASFVAISITAVSKNNYLLRLKEFCHELQPNLRQHADKVNALVFEMLKAIYIGLHSYDNKTGVYKSTLRKSLFVSGRIKWVSTRRTAFALVKKREITLLTSVNHSFPQNCKYQSNFSVQVYFNVNLKIIPGCHTFFIPQLRLEQEEKLLECKTVCLIGIGQLSYLERNSFGE